MCPQHCLGGGDWVAVHVCVRHLHCLSSSILWFHIFQLFLNKGLSSRKEHRPAQPGNALALED